MASSAFTAAFLLFLGTYIRLHRHNNPPYREFGNPTAEGNTPTAAEKQSVVAEARQQQTYGNMGETKTQARTPPAVSTKDCKIDKLPTLMELKPVCADIKQDTTQQYVNSSKQEEFSTCEPVYGTDSNGNVKAGADVHFDQIELEHRVPHDRHLLGSYNARKYFYDQSLEELSLQSVVVNQTTVLYSDGDDDDEDNDDNDNDSDAYVDELFAKQLFNPNQSIQDSEDEGYPEPPPRQRSIKQDLQYQPYSEQRLT